jgi:putative transposase
MTTRNQEPVLSATDWHHAPPHRFIPGCTYMITAGTIGKNHLFDNGRKLQGLQRLMFETAVRFSWTVTSWCLLSNHYHLTALAAENARSLSRWIQCFHALSAALVNGIDKRRGRRVWYQYWDKCITFEASYWPRVNYVNNNAVRHCLVKLACQYPFCSARWTELHGSSPLRRKLKSFRYDRIREPDDFAPIPIP